MIIDPTTGNPFCVDRSLGSVAVSNVNKHGDAITSTGRLVNFGGVARGVARPSAYMREQIAIMGRPDDCLGAMNDAAIAHEVSIALRAEFEKRTGKKLALTEVRSEVMRKIGDARKARRSPDLFDIPEATLRKWSPIPGMWRLSEGDTAESDTLGALFTNGTMTSGFGSGSLQALTSAAGSNYVNTATVNPGETGTQLTGESAYTGSTGRVAIARSSSGYTKSGTAPTQEANAAAITFAACTGGSETETYFVVGYASTSTGTILFYGALTASLAVSNGITPSFAIGALICTMD